MRKTILILLSVFCIAGIGASQKTAPNGMKKGKWKSKDRPDKTWLLKKVGRYQFQSNCELDFIKRLGKHMNLMFKVYKKFSPPTKTAKQNLVIKVFQDRPQFLEYGAPPSAAAYYSGRDHEMVGYNTGLIGGVWVEGGTTSSGKKPGLVNRMRRRYTMDTLGVFSHEGWHQYFHWSCGSKIPFPSWLDEGIGDYFYTCYVYKNEIITGAPMEGRLERIKNAIRKKSYVPLDKMVRYEQSDYYSGNRGQNYAQGWSMVHFFMEHPDYKGDRRVQRFVKIFKDEHSIKKTVPQVFKKKTKWDKIDKDWRDWIVAMPLEPAEDSDATDFDIIKIQVDAANKLAAERFAQLEPHVQKALQSCLDRRPSVRMKKKAPETTKAK